MGSRITCEPCLWKIMLSLLKWENPLRVAILHRLDSWTEEGGGSGRGFPCFPPWFELSGINYLGFLWPWLSCHDVCKDNLSSLLLLLSGILIQQQDNWYSNVIQILNYTLLKQPRSRNNVGVHPQWIDFFNVVYICKGILFTPPQKKEWHCVICNNRNGITNLYNKWSKPSTWRKIPHDLLMHVWVIQNRVS